MTETLLKQLYAGQIHPNEIIVCKDPEYKKLNQKISNETQYFKNALSEKDSQRLEKLWDMLTDRSSAYSYENFNYGFRLGVNLMIEALTDAETLVRNVR